MKKCSKCKQEKDESEFYKNRTKKDTLSYRCKQCDRDTTNVRRKNNPEQHKKAVEKWQRENPERVRNMILKRRYNISTEEYNNLLKLQNNVCAICGKPETEIRRGRMIGLSVDHNHKTNKNRGLLCDSCNKLLGHAHEDPEILLKAEKYLRSYE